MKHLLFTLSTLSIVFFAMVSQAAPGIESKEFPAGEIKKLRVKNNDGHVTISMTAGPRATVTVTKNKFEDKCTLTIEKSGSELYVAIDDKGFIRSSDCQADMDISVPREINTKVSNGSGNVKIEGLTGELEYALGSGQLKAVGEFKSIEGKTGSGEVQIDGLAGNGDFKSGSGDLQIKFSSSAKKGHLDIKSGSGNATLLFAKGSNIKADLKAGSGKLTNEFKGSPKADFKVSMKAGSGNLDIKSY